MSMSRSPAAILAYLCRRGRTLEEALEILQRGVGEQDSFFEPHEVFLEQLRDYSVDSPYGGQVRVTTPQIEVKGGQGSKGLLVLELPIFV